MIQTETLKLLEWQRLCQHLATFAATKLGARAAMGLTIPESLEETQELLQQTKEVYKLEQQVDNRWCFEGIKDITEALARLELGGILSGKELLDVAATMGRMRSLRKLIEDREELKALQRVVIQVKNYPEIVKDIEYQIDERGEVADRASPKLAEVRTKVKELKERIYQNLQQLMQRHSNAVQEQLITQRGDRFVIPVKASHKDHIPGIVHDTSGSGVTLYVEPYRVAEIGNQLRQAQRQEQREEEAIRQQLSQRLTEVHEDLERLLVAAITLDLATAKARYSYWLKANPPEFVDYEQGAKVSLIGLRHPLLLWQQYHEQGPTVVPINVKIQLPVKVVAITGPNTGGKTVTLKTMGIALLMAKVGLFLPASDPVVIPWFQQVLADIGDEQSIEQSLSTFSGHIRRIGRIIEALQQHSNSLVLLDEVGAGTDPTEGQAIAIALLKYLAEHALISIATTHYGELKALKYQDDRFENASVEFDEDTLQPTYHLLWGIPGRSNAITIARRLGLAGEILNQAQTLVGREGTDVSLVIEALTKQRQEQELKAKQAKELLAETEKFYQEVSQKALFLQEREQQLKLEQDQKIQSAIADAREEIAKVIRQLQQGTPSAQKAQQATDSLQQIANTHIKKTPPPKPGYLPQVGEKIKLINLNQTADVLTNPDEEGKLYVRFGSFAKMRVSLEDIQSLDGKKPEITPKAPPKTYSPPPPNSSSTPVTIRTSQNTIDLRGTKVADAEIEIDRALAQANGVLWIVHGKGTGKLREGIHNFLRQHPAVSRFQLGEEKEGGAGVTIVYL